MVERFPHVFSFSEENIEAKREFLRGVGVTEDQLWQVGSSTFV
jgi:hypothetical protein